MEFKLLDGTQQKLSCPVVVDTDLYLGAKMKQTPYMNEVFGYSFELLVLYAQSLGLCTVWVGETMDRGAHSDGCGISMLRETPNCWHVNQPPHGLPERFRKAEAWNRSTSTQI